MHRIGTGLVSFVVFFMLMVISSPAQQLDGQKDLRQLKTAIYLSLIFGLGMALIF